MVKPSISGLVVYNSLQRPLNGMNRSLIYAAPHLKSLGIHLHFITAHTPLRTVKQLLRLRLKEDVGGFDFVLFNSLASFTPHLNPWGMSFAAWVKRLGKPLWIYWHETEWAFRLAEKNGLNSAYLKSLVDDSTTRHLVASNACAEYIGVKFPAGKRYFLYECADVSYTDPLPSAVTQPLVLTVSSIQERKGTDLFLETATKVCSLHPSVKFVWVGSGAALGEFQESIFQRGLRDRVILTGHVERPANLLSLASIFFLPSRDDPFPLSVLEAMALGRTIVTFNLGGAPEALDGNGILIPPFDTDQAATEILRLLDQPQEQLIRPVLRERYLKNYAPEPFAVRLNSIIRESLGR
jgi:glycosyltransferase involved in cell wall biosynthesis